ncbi:hypothetical protein BDF19DRAFT_453182 [Syncephalis fuscata]|nr:hypothetical protein BDF19DRAFT_453182 [Syncephalis fuscata]
MNKEADTETEKTAGNSQSQDTNTNGKDISAESSEQNADSISAADDNRNNNGDQNGRSDISIDDEYADQFDSVDLSNIEGIGPNFQSPQEQEAYDDLVAKAIVDFFQGKFDKAERAFSIKADKDPLSALTIGAMKFFSAVMTCEEVDIDAANHQLNYCCALADQERAATRPVSGIASVANAATSAVTSVGKFFGGVLFGNGQPSGKKSAKQHKQSRSSSMSSSSVAEATLKRHNSELRDDVIGAESLLLIALIQLLQESMVGFLKAGLNLRRGYKQYESLWKEVKQCGGLNTSLIDRHTLSGVSFGIGTINVVLSALPAKILRMVSVFGYTGDRELGFEMLNNCLDQNGLLSPLALMFLIFFYAALTPFAPEVLEPIYGRKADEYIVYAQKHYPGSSLYGILIARYARQRRNLEQAVNDLTAISDVPWTETERFKSTPLALKSWEALYHLCAYELGMTELYRLNFAKAAEHYKKLAEVHYWSQITCRYLQAVCMEAAGDLEGAETAYNQVKEISVRKYSGRVISSDQYVLRKLKMREESIKKGVEQDSWRRALEQIERCRDWAERALETATGDDRVVTLWISGCMLKELGELDKADEQLRQAGRIKMQNDTLVGPFARYERGVVAWLRGNKEDAKKHWDKAQAESNDYNFEFRLAFRIHLCHVGMEDAAQAEKTPTFIQSS